MIKSTGISTRSQSLKKTVRKPAKPSPSNTSYISLKYISDDENDGKETQENIIINLRNKLADELSHNESLITENNKLKSSINDIKKHLAYKEEIIEKLNKALEKLSTKKFLYTTGTQTDVPLCNISTQTHYSTENCDISIQTEIICDSPVDIEINPFLDKNTKKKIRSEDEIITDGVKVKENNILILSDQHGKKLNLQLRDRLDFQIKSIIKPNGLFKHIIENIQTEVKDFTMDDFVIILGGSNDIYYNKIDPSFRCIVDIIQRYTNTNIIYLSIPITNKVYAKNILKFNIKLEETIKELNHTYGNVTYLEFNGKTRILNKNYTADAITNHIKYLTKISGNRTEYMTPHLNSVNNNIVNHTVEESRKLNPTNEEGENNLERNERNKITYNKRQAGINWNNIRTITLEDEDGGVSFQDAINKIHLT